jgi:hypothetical protein
MYFTFLFTAFIFNTICFSAETRLQKIDVTILGNGALTKEETVMSNALLKLLKKQKLNLFDFKPNHRESQTQIALKYINFDCKQICTLIDLFSLYTNKEKKNYWLEFVFGMLSSSFIKNEAKKEELLVAHHILKRDDKKVLFTKEDGIINFLLSGEKTVGEIAALFDSEKKHAFEFISPLNRDFVRLILINSIYKEKSDLKINHFLEEFTNTCKALQISEIEFETKELKEKIECDLFESFNKKIKLDTSL